MPTAPTTFRPHGERTKVQRDREADERRGSARDRGYTTAWTKAAKAYLHQHPLCGYCELAGDVTPATAVDHLYPHRGDRELFWKSCWWVSTCAACHSGFKQSIERRGRAALDALAHRLGRPGRG
jgi:5-methylcytosine-specific restriction protein A